MAAQPACELSESLPAATWCRRVGRQWLEAAIATKAGLCDRPSSWNLPLLPARAAVFCDYSMGGSSVVKALPLPSLMQNSVACFSSKVPAVAQQPAVQGKPCHDQD